MLDGKSRYPNLALAFATIERPHVVQRLVQSSRRHFPEMPIHVADQSLTVAAMEEFYARFNVNVVRMPYDAGVCASRNRLVAAIREDYIVLCDDDFVFGPQTDFQDAIRIMEQRPDIGVVGGRLYDYDAGIEYSRHWERFLYLDQRTRTLASIPMYHFAPRVERVDDVQFYACDAVMNFAVMRRSMFCNPAIRWDERFKSNGEHEDFYLNLKLNSSVKVVYLPTLIAYHHHPTEFVRYRSQLRDRTEGWRRLLEKWGIDQHLEIGLGVRTIDELNAAVAPAKAAERFFLNDNLSLRHDRDHGVLHVDRESSLRAVSGLDRHGLRRDRAGHVARISVTHGGVLRVVPEAVGDGGSDLTPMARHSFVSTEAPLDPYPPRGDVLIRYCPIARTDADFIIWYRLVPGSESAEPRTTALHVRWFDDQNRILMWEGNRNLLDLRRSDYWVPLLVESPMIPKASTYVRFEVVAGEHGGRRRIGVGYLCQPDAGSSHAALSEPMSMDVLALIPGPPMAAQMATPISVSDDNPGSNQGGVTSTPSNAATGLVLLAIHGGTSATSVVFSEWTGLGSALAHCHLPLAGEVALPKSALSTLRLRFHPREPV